MRRQTILGAVSALALITAAPALAQDARPLAPGASLQGELDEGDPAGPDDAYRYDDYRIAARAGQRFEATMSAEDFDAYLEVFREGALDQSIASDDDGMGEDTTNARLRFTASDDGVYILRARALSGLDGGDYALTLADRGAAPRPPRPGGIRLGQTVRGELTGRDPEGEDGIPYDAWVFRARQGDRFAIALDSEAFDPMVRVGRMDGPAFTELARNDDGADSGLNSRLVFTAPANGDFVIRATPLNNSGQGVYTLSLEEGPPPLAAQEIAIGDTVSGELTASDGKSETGLSADAYRFAGSAGQRVRIDLTSSDFDAYLQLFDESHASLAEDDDGGPDGTNSRIVFTLPADGTYVIEARPFSEATGDYSLSIEAVAPPPAPLALTFGEPVEGKLDETTATDEEDRRYQDYSFAGTEGQRIQAIMRSGDFDSFLQVSSAEGDFSQLAADDDGLGEGTDSRVNFTLPETGTYILRASPLSKGEDGLFSVQLIDRGPQPEPGSILVGATARGTLSDADATAEDNSFYDAYRVTLKEDEKLVVTMVSNDVDSYVVVGRPKDDDGFEVLGSDDDSLSDTHAKLEWTAPSDGVYEIRAGSFQQGETGAYALTVEKGSDD